MQIKVMVIDDSTARAKRWKDKLTKAYGSKYLIDAPEKAAITALVKALNLRRQLARQDKDWRKEKCAADGLDILLIDFDLIDLGNGQTESVTGETVAYLARLFSSAKIISVVNQFGTNRFDLTLVADRSMRNDLDISSAQLTNPGLWSAGLISNGFRPWHWPTLGEEVTSHVQRARDVRKNLKVDLREFFGFDTSGTKLGRGVPEGAIAYFQHSISKVTFQSILSSAPFVDPKDSPALRKDGEQAAWVAAAIVHKWLERWVLVRQDILVDLPHLIARKPWLLKTPKKQASWNQTTTLSATNAVTKDLEKYRFAKKHWISRPVYWGEEINLDESLAFPKKSWKFDAIPKLVFREDTSNFGLRDESLEFDCELGTSYDLRHVCNPQHVSGLKGDVDPRDVDYTPATKLAR